MYLDLQMDAMLKLNLNIRTVQEKGFFPGVALTMEIGNVRMENLIIIKFSFYTVGLYV